MKLFTEEIEKQLQANYKFASDMDQLVIIKIFNPYGAGTWYVMNQDPNDTDYLWGIVDLNVVEMGSFSKKDLTSIRFTKYYLSLERDEHFQPVKASELYKRLLNGEKV